MARRRESACIISVSVHLCIASHHALGGCSNRGRGLCDPGRKDLSAFTGVDHLDELANRRVGALCCANKKSTWRRRRSWRRRRWMHDFTYPHDVTELSPIDCVGTGDAK